MSTQISIDWLNEFALKFTKNQLTVQEITNGERIIKNGILYAQFPNSKVYWETVNILCTIVTHADNNHDIYTSKKLTMWDTNERLTDFNMCELMHFIDVTTIYKINTRLCSKIVHELVARALDNLPIQILPQATDEEHYNCIKLFDYLAPRCDYTKTSDQNLTNIGRLHLGWNDMQLVESGMLYEILTDIHGLKLNDMIRPEIDIGDTLSRIKFDSVATVFDYTRAVGVIKEFCDDPLSDLLINKDVVTATHLKTSGPIVINNLNVNVGDTYGILQNDGTLQLRPEHNPIASCLLAWAIASDCKQLIYAIQTPSKLQPLTTFAQAFTE